MDDWRSKFATLMRPTHATLQARHCSACSTRHAPGRCSLLKSLNEDVRKLLEQERFWIKTYMRNECSRGVRAAMSDMTQSCRLDAASLSRGLRGAVRAEMDQIIVEGNALLAERDSAPREKEASATTGALSSPVELERHLTALGTLQQEAVSAMTSRLEMLQQEHFKALHATMDMRMEAMRLELQKSARARAQLSMAAAAAADEGSDEAEAATPAEAELVPQKVLSDDCSLDARIDAHVQALRSELLASQSSCKAAAARAVLEAQLPSVTVLVADQVAGQVERRVLAAAPQVLAPAVQAAAQEAVQAAVKAAVQKELQLKLEGRLEERLTTLEGTSARLQASQLETAGTASRVPQGANRGANQAGRAGVNQGVDDALKALTSKISTMGAQVGRIERRLREQEEAASEAVELLTRRVSTEQETSSELGALCSRLDERLRALERMVQQEREEGSAELDAVRSSHGQLEARCAKLEDRCRRHEQEQERVAERAALVSLASAPLPPNAPPAQSFVFRTGDVPHSPTAERPDGGGLKAAMARLMTPDSPSSSGGATPARATPGAPTRSWAATGGGVTRAPTSSAWVPLEQSVVHLKKR